MVNVNFSKLFLWLMPFAFVFLTDDCCGQLIDFEEIAEISKDSLKTISGTPVLLGSVSVQTIALEDKYPLSLPSIFESFTPLFLSFSKTCSDKDWICLDEVPLAMIM